MMNDLLQSAEEAFFERYFDYGDDMETALSNLDSSLNVYYRAQKECAGYAEQVSDGEVVDGYTVTLALQNLIFSHKFVERFGNSLGYDGAALDLESIELTGKTSQQLAAEGTQLLSSSKNPINVPGIIKGKYLLFAAMNS